MRVLNAVKLISSFLSVAFLPTLEACAEIEGLIVPVFTPFSDDGCLLLDVIPPYAQYLKDRGCDGVIVGDTIGEGPTLSVDENKSLLDAWKEVTSLLGLLFVASVGGTPLSDTIEVAQYAQELEVDCIFYLPEPFYKPKTTAELVDDMKIIADCVCETPIVYDDYPEYSDLDDDVDIEEFFDLATQKIDNFLGVKSNCFENLLKLRTKLECDQKLFVSNYLYLAPAVFMGFKDFVLVELNFFPKLIYDIIYTGQNRNLTRSIYYYDTLVALIDCIVEDEDNEIAYYKEALPLFCGVDVGPVRSPLDPLSEDEIDALKERLENCYGEIFDTDDDDCDCVAGDCDK